MTTLYCGDSKHHIQTLPDHSVDLIFTDPPYNLAGYSTGNIEMSWRTPFNNDIGAWDETVFDPAEWLSEFQRVLKPTGNIFAFTAYNLQGRWHQIFDNCFDTFQMFYWHKTNPPPKLRRAGFLNSVESLVCMWNKGHVWNFTTQAAMHNHFESPICMGKERVKDPDTGKTLHPSQKPLKLLKHIISLTTNPGDVVYDPFMGVGSTGVAAVDLGREFIGAELEQKFYWPALNRIKMAKDGFIY